MSREELLRLADACERAEGPDRLLDGAIATALGEPDAFGSPLRHKVVRAHIPEYTTSLDAAQGLVPEGWVYMAINAGVGKPKPALGRASAFVGHPDNMGDIETVEAATPPLALVSAALRAHANQEPGQ